MSPFDAYQQYLGIQTHFKQPEYDYFKMGKRKVSSKAFDARKDKYFFSKLAAHPNPQYLQVLNIVDSLKPVYVRDLVQEKSCEEIYLKGMKKIRGLTYHIKNSLAQFEEPLYHYLSVPENQHPLLLKKHLRNEVDLETMIALDWAWNFFPLWNKKLNHDPYWTAKYLVIRKYKPFIFADHDEITKIVKTLAL